MLQGVRLRGALAGIELCRTLRTYEDFQRMLDGRAAQEDALRRGDVDAYWEHRYCTLQLEYCLEVLKVAWGIYPQSARAVLAYAGIVGVGVQEGAPFSNN